ncbi:MAG: hypothetical protein WCG03_05745 [Kiritimatiellales bacterium]
MKKVFNIFKKRLCRIVEKQGGSTSISIAPTLKSAGNSLVLSGSTIEAETLSFAKTTVGKNVLRINTVDAEHFQPLEPQELPLLAEEIVKSLCKGGGGQKQVFDYLMKIKGVTEKQAKLIARDQNGKIHSQLTLERMKGGGITKAKWNHSGAGRAPREYHRTKWDGVSHNPPNGLDGYIFDINNPPIADLETGERAVPGELFDCKCYATPVIEF